MAGMPLPRLRGLSPCSPRAIRSRNLRRRSWREPAYVHLTGCARGRRRLLGRRAVDARAGPRSALVRLALRRRPALGVLGLPGTPTGRDLGAAYGLDNWCGRGRRRLRCRRGRGSRRRSRSRSRPRSRTRCRLRHDRWRRRCRRWRTGGGRRRGCRGRAGGTPRREQAEWVDVRVAVADPDAEMDVEHVVLRIARRTGVRDRISLADRLALPDAERPEMRERGLVAVRGHDRDRQPVRRDLTGERDLPGRGRTNRRCPRESDVDAAMLPGGVLVVLHREPPQHRPIRGPCPGRGRAGAEDERQGGDRADT